MSLTQEQIEFFHREGYVIVSGLFEPEQIAAARRETELISYGMSFDEYLVSSQRKRALEELGDLDSAEAQNAFVPGRNLFPTGIRDLDSLLEKGSYLDCFKQLLGTDELTNLMAHLFVRSGPDDKRHAPEKWQGYHIDDYTNSFLPPHPDVPNYQYINSWVALHDIEADGAPLHVIPRSHRQLKELLPRLAKSGDGIRGPFRDIREVPEFAPAVKAIMKTGDALFYSSYLVHAAVGFENKTRQRALWTMSMGRAANDSWTRYCAPEERVILNSFWEQTTATVRSATGWPPPGDPYYTPETLEMLSFWFPNMDLCELH